MRPLTPASRLSPFRCGMVAEPFRNAERADFRAFGRVGMISAMLRRVCARAGAHVHIQIIIPTIPTLPVRNENLIISMIYSAQNAGRVGFASFQRPSGAAAACVHGGRP